MYNEVPEDLMAKIKEAEGTINKHNSLIIPSFWSRVAMKV